MFSLRFFFVLKLARKHVLSDKRCRACPHVTSSNLLTDSGTKLTDVSDPGEAVGVSVEDRRSSFDYDALRHVHRVVTTVLSVPVKLREH